MSKQIINVPDIGGAEDVEVIEIGVSVGDTVLPEEILVVLESDKASMEIPCPVAGVVTAILLKEGDKVGEGAAMVELELEGESTVEGSENPVVEEPVIETAPETQADSAAPEPAAIAVTQAAEVLVSVPDIGGSEAVEVIEISVSAGDVLEEGDSMIVLESDKASMEIPAPQAGTVVELRMAVGDSLSQGDPILLLLPQAEAAAVSEVVEESAPAPQLAETAPATPSPAIQAPAPAEELSTGSGDGVHAGPAVRKLAREFGVLLAEVKGSGPRSRILKEDIQAHVKAALQAPPSSGGSAIPSVPAVDFSKFGPVREEKLSKIGRVTATNMQRSWLNVPHVTQFDDADISDLEEFRAAMKPEAAERGVKLTPMPFLLKACALALKRHEKINSSLSADGEGLVFKDYVHIGIAVDTPAGLMVPVLRDVDKKSLYEIAAEVVVLAAKARDRKLMPADMQGACFTISSLGGMGGKGFTPIVNAPEVAILGVSRLETKPVWNGSEFVPRKMLPLSLSYDHRVVNGADGGRFLNEVISLLNDVRRLSL
ncbi:MAG: dihydrolipoyllysine-residue acetyltransferase [Pseudomonadales bacterium]